jgi:F420-dependent oxidoreductase-like protein
MLGYFGAGTTADEQLELVREAERLGYDSAWVAEAYGSDAATVLAWLAAQTSRIHLGSAVFQIPARSPAMTAMTAATLDQLSGGRFRLGLGLSGPQVAEGWHGQRYDRPLARTRDYLSVVRLALERQRVAYQGETLQLPLPDGPGKALKLTIAPAQQRLPIYLAAMGPQNLALAGELADGWLGFLFAVVKKFGDDKGGNLTTLLAWNGFSPCFRCCSSWSPPSASSSAASPPWSSGC